MLTDTERDAEFAAFVAEHRGSLLRIARLLAAGDDAAAEDVLQTTLTRLYVGWRRVRRADNRLAYARTSLTHAFVDESRRAHRRRELTTGRPAETYDGPAPAAADPDLRPLVVAALADLGPRQRAVVVLRHWLDLDVAETARVLGCSTGTVKSQNARALEHLRTALGPSIHPVPEESA